MSRRLSRASALLFLVAVLLIGTERPASAYIDPGTGAIIWQSVVALLAGIGFSFRRFIFRLKNRKGRNVE